MRLASHRTGFTIVELLVVITIIVVLLALLMPAMDKAIESALRVKCAANLHAIQVGTATYGIQNRRMVFSCRLGLVNHAFDKKDAAGGDPNDPNTQVDWPAALASAGLASLEKQQVNDKGDQPALGGHVDNLPGSMWNCPSREPWESKWGTDLNGWAQMIIGYHFYGGTKTWYSPWHGALKAASPRKLSDPGSWALASDATAKINGQWRGVPENHDLWGNSPPHTDGAQFYPAGHNQVFMDGSAQWLEADRLLMIHSWNNSTNELYFFWQNDLAGWNPGENDPSWLRANK